MVRWLLFFLAFPVAAQTTISGTVTAAGKPVPDANVVLEGSYDGGLTDTNGAFAFQTSETGSYTLLVIAGGFETFRKSITLPCDPLQIQLKADGTLLDAVVINAGSFEAGEKARASVLKPLDIVTTAGSAGNIIAALQTLPGSQVAGEDGRLFVRGGEAGETQTFVDGLRVAQPYGPIINNIPARGRFSPFLFSGIAFSTGGFSAEYGEALSGVLLLNTRDEELEEKTDISLMSVGVGIGHTLKREKQSLSVNLSYIDLAPYQVAIPQNIKWNRPFRSASGEAVYRRHFENMLWKVYGAFEATTFDVDRESINEPVRSRVDLQNANFYFNSSLQGRAGAWDWFAGTGYGFADNKINLFSGEVNNSEHSLHVKAKANRRLFGKVRLLTGLEYFATTFREQFQDAEQAAMTGFTSNLMAAFTETEWIVSRTVSLRSGVRFSFENQTANATLDPRISLGWKPAKEHQISFAYGNFHQLPSADFLKFANQYGVQNEEAEHFILNYTFNKNKRTLRGEFYYKNYDNLLRFDSPFAPETFRNDGRGYAAGFDLFWRDNASIRNLEYWVSYSLIDTRRRYRDFPVEATPAFNAKHTASLVTKYWVESLRSQIGITYTVASGRPFTNPNQSGFLQGRTPAFNNVSIGWAYLIDQQKILYFSASNVFNSANVFGYEYANNPGSDGVFQRREIIPTADRFFFIGFFWTISDDKKSNQLNTL